MHVIFVGGFFPLEMMDKLRKNSKGQIANANNTLQWSIINGLQSNKVQFDTLTLPQVGAFPLNYKKLYVSGSKGSIEGGGSFKSIGFINLMFLKHYFKYYAIKKELFKSVKLYNEEKIVLLIYDLYPPYLKVIAQLKRVFPKLVTCCVVPDLCEFTGAPKGFIYRIFGKTQGLEVFRSLIEVDSFVLLSKYMIEKLPIGNKPWVLMEGIYNEMDLSISRDVVSCKRESKILFYSGAIDRRNGIVNLVEAFMKIEDDSYLLVLCGDGYERNYVLESANKDKRIIYKGQVSRRDVLQMQQHATLLVNPRSPEGEFTRYSFPSKTMEYFASGIPTFMYKLDGIPPEYYQYCYTCDDLSIDALSLKLVEICNLDKMTLKRKGNVAREFILSHKNSRVQVGKIISLLKLI